LAKYALEYPDNPIQVAFRRANLDGGGKFNFLIAFYAQESGGAGVYMRVFNLLKEKIFVQIEFFRSL